METLVLSSGKKAIKSYHTSMLINKVALIISDLLAFYLAFYLSWLYFDVSVINSNYNDRFFIIVLIILITLITFWGKFRHYSYRKPFWSELKDIFFIVLLSSLLDYTISSIAKINVYFIQWVFIWGGSLILVPFSRFLIKKLLIRMGFWFIPSIIIGSGENAIEALKAIRSESLMGFNIKNFISVSDNKTKELYGLNVLKYEDSNILSLSNFKIFIALEYNERELRDHIIRKLTSVGITNISVIPSTRGIPLYDTDISYFFSHEVMMLRLNNNLVRRTSRIIKRTFDIIVSFVLLILLLPLFLFVSYKVKKDGGPATYGHERIGYQGKKFKCLKFRTMVVNSQEVLSDLLKKDAQAREEWNKDFKLKNDPRITSIGKFLRKSSLDELPQLWNVFKGEMSLVGPRPIIEEETLRYKGNVDYYLLAKPGMSGLWQISGRNDIDYETRVYLDSWYVKNWSLWSDIAILFKTVAVVLKRDGAY